MLKYIFKYTVVCFSAYIATINVSNAQVFSVDSKYFLRRYNDFLVLDGGAPLEKCKDINDGIECNFSNKIFQKQVAGFKKMGIISGDKFYSNERIVLKLNGSNIEMIILKGTRGDPANLFSLLGDIQIAMKVLSPKALSSDELSANVTKLGLMRGDSDPTIGIPKNIKEPYADISCNNQSSNVSMDFGCVFRPVK